MQYEGCSLRDMHSDSSESLHVADQVRTRPSSYLGWAEMGSALSVFFALVHAHCCFAEKLGRVLRKHSVQPIKLRRGSTG